MERVMAQTVPVWWFVRMRPDATRAIEIRGLNFPPNALMSE